MPGDPIIYAHPAGSPKRGRVVRLTPKRIRVRLYFDGVWSESTVDRWHVWSAGPKTAAAIATIEALESEVPS